MEADPGSVSRPQAGGAEYGSASLAPSCACGRCAHPIPCPARNRAPARRAHRRPRRVDRPRGRGRRGPGRARLVSSGASGDGRTVRLVLLMRSAGRAPSSSARRPGPEGWIQPARSRSVSFTVIPKPEPKPSRRPTEAEAPGARDADPDDPRRRAWAGQPPECRRVSCAARTPSGGDDARFGAGRTGHTHEDKHHRRVGHTRRRTARRCGAASTTTASGAGRYVVLHADDGWSIDVRPLPRRQRDARPGRPRRPRRPALPRRRDRRCERPSPAASSCWPDGWRHLKGTRPIDPLPHLRRWAAG